MKITTDNKGKSGIYCIHNTINNKKYIGSSINIYQRLLAHRSYLRKNIHANSHLQNAFNKYSESNFKCFVLEYCEEIVLIEKEQYYINLFNSEYNITKEIIRNIRNINSCLKQSITRKELFKNKLLKIHNAKKIKVYHKNGKYINSFNSIRETCKELNIDKDSITRILNGKYKQCKNYIFLTNREIELKDIIFGRDNNIIVLTINNKKIYFRSIAKCAEYLNEKEGSLTMFFRTTKRPLFKNKYKIDLVKSCELLESLEADDQQPSDIEIY